MSDLDSEYVVINAWNTTGTRTLTGNGYNFFIKNTGTVNLTFTINGLTFTVKPLEEFEEVFDPFTQVVVTATSTFNANVSGLKSGSTNPLYSVKDYFSGSANTSRSFSGSVYGIVVSNDGASALTYTVNGITLRVEAGDVVEEYFNALTQVTINSTVAFRAYVKSTFNTAITGSPTVADVTAPVVTATPAPGSFNATQSVVLTGTDSGGTVIIYYTIDGTTPTQSSTVYSSAILVNATTTIKYFGKDPTGNVSTVQTALYTIDTVAPTVTASVLSGTYKSTQSVTLTGTDNSGGAVTIYYTIDNSTPTISSTVYTAPISVSATTTLKYFGRDTAGNSGTVQSQVYTINLVSNLAADTFTRADTTITTDSTTTLGSAETGGTWTNRNVGLNYGVISNQAYLQRINTTGQHHIWPVTVPVSATNYAVEVTVAVLEISVAGRESLVFRLDAAGSGDSVFLRRGAKYEIIQLVWAGSPTIIRRGNITPAAGDVLRVECYDNNRIKTFVNNVLDMDVINSLALSATTKVGFACETNVSRFDDFRVMQLSSIAADTIPPLEISGLSTWGVTKTVIGLQWTTGSPSADIKSYQIYNGVSLVGTVGISPSGDIGNYTVISGLNANTSYTFTVKSLDWSGNLSTGVSVTRSTAA